MTIRCLTQLYTIEGLLRDGDGDGLPDGFRAWFSVGRTPGAIDVAARLGLESAAFTPGFARVGGLGATGAADAAGEHVAVCFGPENPDCPAMPVPPGCGIVALTDSGLVVTGDSPETGWAAARWLAETYPLAGPEGGLLGEQAGGQPVQAVILQGGRVVEVRTRAASERSESGLAALSGEKPTLEGPPAAPPHAAFAPGDLPPEGPAQLFTVVGLLGSSDSARPDRAGWQVQVAAVTTPAEIAGLCELAARTGVEATGLRFPFAIPAAATPALPAVRLDPLAPADARWTEGHMAWGPGGLTLFGSPAERVAALRIAAEAGLVDGLHATLFTRRAALPEGLLPEGEPVFDVTLEAEWEVAALRKSWRELVADRLTPGLPAVVDIRISEPLAVRQEVALELTRSLNAAAVTDISLRVRSAYKQGFHWLEEEMLPRLAALGPLERVEVTVARFGGAPVPAMGPLDDAAVMGAGVAPKSGGSGEYRGPEGVTRSGQPLDLPIRWLQELYPADEMLAAQLGIPVAFALADTAQEAAYRLTAWRPDGTVALQERFDSVYVSQPYLPEFPLRGTVHPPTGRLYVEQAGQVLADVRLATDAEALWALYQAEVLPRLRRYITEKFGAAPDPAQQPFFGKLVVEASLSEDDRPLGVRAEMISPLDAMHEDLYFYTLDYLGELGISLIGKGYPAPGAVEPWIVCGSGGPRARVRLYPRPEVAATVGGLPAHAADLPQPAPGIPMDVLIGPDQLPPYLAYLARLPGVRVWRAGLSFAGRPTWALSVTAPTAGRIAPPQKLSAWRPTLLVNARHHANEVSSTNSALKLAEQVATSGLASQINLVVSPMENVDGAAVHYAMQAVHPTWKLHAARFNAAGVDFGFDSFAPEPRFGESRTQPTLWRAFQPDILVDDHGYPSNEWVQPFSGYNSPPYFRTSWWMPNALIYGIHRWMDPARFPQNAAVQAVLRDALADRLVSDPRIENYTRILLERFVTYGQRYLPEKFPLQTHRGFVSLTGNVQAGPDARSYVGRFPHITAAELVTEVPDETAQGDSLALCAYAHLEGDRAVLELLTGHPQTVVRRRWEEDGAVFWSVGRERPFAV